MRFLSVYKDLKSKGSIVSPRDQKVLEIQDYMFTMGPRDRFTSYSARHLNLDYAKFEMVWYLTGDKLDKRITKSAAMWSDLRQPDGSWFSNYGQYWFGDPQQGFEWVINQLFSDKDSRQAVIPMLHRRNLFTGNKDVVCTQCISFRIRDNKLYMSVNMRSQDAIWGMTNDIFCFSVLHEMIYVVLRDGKYHNLVMGSYTHKVDSFHVYEKHFGMLDRIIIEGHGGYTEIYCPEIYDNREVMNLLNYKARDCVAQHLFTEWLYENRYSDGHR